MLLCDKPYEERAVPEYTAMLLRRLQYAHVLVRERLQRAAESASSWYDRRVCLKTFEIGDEVRVYNPRRYKGRTPKWQLFYKEKATVLRRINEATYVAQGPSMKRPKVVHIDKLKPSKIFP